MARASAVFLAASLLLPPSLGGEDAAGLVELLTPEVELALVRVPDSETLCVAGAVVRFRLAREARVSLSAQGVSAPAPALLPPGVHELAFSGGRRQGLAMGEQPFALAATEIGGSQTVTVSGKLRDERLDRAVMRVGRTFVSGVDLLESMAQPRTMDELVAVLTAKYDVTTEQAAESVTAFLEHGIKTGIVTAGDAP